jgi:hypothetical protein
VLCVGVGVTDVDGVTLCVGEGVGLFVGDNEGVGLFVGVGEGVGVKLCVGEGVGLFVGDNEGVGLFVGVGVALRVSEGVGVALRVGVGEGVGVTGTESGTCSIALIQTTAACTAADASLIDDWTACIDAIMLLSAVCSKSEDWFNAAMAFASAVNAAVLLSVMISLG